MVLRFLPLLLLLASPIRAQQVGLLIVAHGAGPDWNAAVRETVSQVHWQHGPVATAFLMGPEAAISGWDSALVQLVRQGASSVAVVPLMVSSHGSHFRQVQHYAGLVPRMPAELAGHAHAMSAPTMPMAVAPALDASAEIGEVLSDRWRMLPAALQRRPVLIVGHGPETDEDAARWLEQLGTATTRLRDAGLACDARVALMRDDAAPAIKETAIGAMRDTLVALATRSRDSVVVLPVMIAAGPLTSRSIPAHLAGLPMVPISIGLTPHPAIARWIERSGATLLSLLR